jgi:hypothetical protein
LVSRSTWDCEEEQTAASSAALISRSTDVVAETSGVAERMLAAATRVVANTAKSALAADTGGLLALRVKREALALGERPGVPHQRGELQSDVHL